VLSALESEVLERHHCYFGGGTAIALRYGEYRESIDIDFTVSDRAGYSELRSRLRNRVDLAPIVKAGEVLDVAREVRVDQYGIRTAVVIAGVAIKFEIVSEGRVAFEVPSDSDRICGLKALSPLDMTTTKLLANSDRWADRSVMSRDLIDLAMMEPPLELLRRAIYKGEQAYQKAVRLDLAKAIDLLRRHPQRVEDCLTSMKMIETPAALLMQRVEDLSARLNKV